MGSFKNFYNGIGLTEYPFSSYTTENEGSKFSQTFIQANDYDTILESFSQRNSIIITGDRGTGKTALLKNFLSTISDENALVIEITDFSQLSIKYKLEDFYKFVITNYVVTLFNSLTNKVKKISILNREEKLLLSYLLKNFVPQISKRQIREKIELIQIPWYKRLYKKGEKVIRSFFNYGATVGGTFIEEYLAKHFNGLPRLTDNNQIRDFFPELPINIEEDFIDQETTFQLLKRIIQLAKKMEFKQQILILDKIDEDQRFANDAEIISEFIEPILTDNKFLLDDDLQVIFSSWVTPFNFIKDQVRTQKHYCPTLQWNEEDLIRALNKRLEAYSDGYLSDYTTLFDASVQRHEIKQVFKISNRNPRDLWHIFNHLFIAQHQIDSESQKIQSDAIANALVAFVTTFNYYEYYPRKSNARANSMDIYSYAKHLLKLDSTIFTKN